MPQQELLHKNHHTCLWSTLHELHWLPVHWHIKFKLASLTFNAIHTGTPPHLSHLLIRYCSSQVLRSSSSSNLLQVPAITLFSVLALSTQLLQLFGTLFPNSFRSSSTFHSFTRHLKHIFTKQLLIPPSGILQRLRRTYIAL